MCFVCAITKYCRYMIVLLIFQNPYCKKKIIGEKRRANEMKGISQVRGIDKQSLGAKTKVRKEENGNTCLSLIKPLVALILHLKPERS